MKQNTISYNIIFVMLAIYIIAGLQFAVKESKELIKISGMTYGDKIDHLDIPYYRNAYYKYYAWLNKILPPDKSFSILPDKTSEKIYTRYERKLNYYFYPRHVLFKGVDVYAYHKAGHLALKTLEYPEFVLVLMNNSIKYSTRDGMKFIRLNGNDYYLTATLDNKGLLVKRSYIKQFINSPKCPNYLKQEFKRLYNKDIESRVF